MRDFYKNAIQEAVEACEDTNLLDLVWKLLHDCTPAPNPVEPSGMEVRFNADHSRDTRLHRAVPIQICRSVKHSGQDHSKLGDQGTKLPAVCGGADSLQSAA